MKEFFTQENQVIAIVLIAVLLFLVMSVSFLVFFFFSRKKIVEKELEKKSLEISNQKEMIQSIIVAQEEDRERIAQDLHDDIGSKLNVINLHANLLKDGGLSKEEYTIVNNTILEASTKTLESARKIAHNLLPPSLEKFGLKDSLEELADSYNNSKKITITYNLKYPKAYLIPKNELHLFRITQELINNSVRHGKAKKSALDITCINNNLLFTYSDNGIGFETNDKNHQKGLGLKNIESRVAILKANYIIESKKDNGFKIFITIIKPSK